MCLPTIPRSLITAVQIANLQSHLQSLENNDKEHNACLFMFFNALSVCLSVLSWLLRTFITRNVFWHIFRLMTCFFTYCVNSFTKISRVSVYQWAFCLRLTNVIFVQEVAGMRNKYLIYGSLTTVGEGNVVIVCVTEKIKSTFPKIEEEE